MLHLNCYFFLIFQMARLLVRWPSILKVRNAFLFILRWQLVLFSVIVVQSLIFSGEPHFSCRGTLMVEKACINPLSPVADNHPPHTATCPFSCLRFVITPSSSSWSSSSSASNGVTSALQTLPVCHAPPSSPPGMPGKESVIPTLEAHQSCQQHSIANQARQQRRTGWMAGWKWQTGCREEL